MSYRPLEIDIELDGGSGDGQVIGAQHRGDLLPEGATLVQINLVLIMLQAHTKLCPAHAPALAIGLEAFTTVSVDVLRPGIVKFLQANLEHALGTGVTGLGEADQGQGPQYYH